MINKENCDGISIKVSTGGESSKQTEQPVAGGSEGDHCCVDLKIVCIVESDFIQHAPKKQIYIYIFRLI